MSGVLFSLRAKLGRGLHKRTHPSTASHNGRRAAFSRPSFSSPAPTVAGLCGFPLAELEVGPAGPHVRMSAGLRVRASCFCPRVSSVAAALWRKIGHEAFSGASCGLSAVPACRRRLPDAVRPGRTHPCNRKSQRSKSVFSWPSFELTRRRPLALRLLQPEVGPVDPHAMEDDGEPTGEREQPGSCRAAATFSPQRFKASSCASASTARRRLRTAG